AQVSGLSAPAASRTASRETSSGAASSASGAATGAPAGQAGPSAATAPVISAAATTPRPVHVTQSPRRAALSRRAFLAAGVLAFVALLAVTIGPAVGQPQVTAQLDAARQVATLDGLAVETGSGLQLTLAGQDLPAGSGTVA